MGIWFKQWVVTVVLCVCLPGLVAAKAPSVQTLLKRSENMMRGKSSYMRMEMRITTPRWSRTVKMESWAKGVDLSFIHIQYPPRDKDVTFLKRSKDMWQYIPKVERTIKIPASMMMQSWMGSDFSNDDLVRESSLIDDYNTRLLETRLKVYIIELIPKEMAPVQWGKVVMHLHREYYVPVYQAFYDEMGGLVREMKMSKIKRIGKRWFPHHWTVIPKDPDKQGHTTNIIIKDVMFDIPIKSSVFSLRELRRKSR